MTDELRAGEITKPEINKRKSLYWFLTIPWLTILTLIILWGVYGGEKNVTNLDQFSEAGILQQAAIALPWLWILTSILLVDYTETAGVTALGYAVDSVGSGPKLLARGLFTLVSFPRTSLQEQFPADPEDVFKGDDSELLPPGQKRALRVTTGAPEKGQRNDDGSDESSILDIQVTVCIFFYLRIEISDALVFALRYGSIEQFWRQIRDTGERVITNEFAKTKGAAQLIENLSPIMNTLNDRFVEIANSGGVTVIESGINSPDLSRTLATALRDIGVARSKAMQSQVMLEKEGTGKAYAEKVLIDSIAEALKNAGPAAVSAYVGERTLNDKTIVLGTDGLTQVMGLAKTISETFKRSDAT